MQPLWPIKSKHSGDKCNLRAFDLAHIYLHLRPIHCKIVVFHPKTYTYCVSQFTIADGAALII